MVLINIIGIFWYMIFYQCVNNLFQMSPMITFYHILIYFAIFHTRCELLLFNEVVWKYIQLILITLTWKKPCSYYWYHISKMARTCAIYLLLEFQLVKTSSVFKYWISLNCCYIGWNVVYGVINTIAIFCLFRRSSNKLLILTFYCWDVSTLKSPKAYV